MDTAAAIEFALKILFNYGVPSLILFGIWHLVRNPPEWYLENQRAETEAKTAAHRTTANAHTKTSAAVAQMSMSIAKMEEMIKQSLKLEHMHYKAVNSRIDNLKVSLKDFNDSLLSELAETVEEFRRTANACDHSSAAAVALLDRIEPRRIWTEEERIRHRTRQEEEHGGTSMRA